GPAALEEDFQRLRQGIGGKARGRDAARNPGQGILDAGNGRGQYRLAAGQGLEHDIWKALETRGEDEAVGAGENRIWIGLEAPEPDPIDETQGRRLAIEAVSLGTGAQYMKGKVAP